MAARYLAQLLVAAIVTGHLAAVPSRIMDLGNPEVDRQNAQSDIIRVLQSRQQEMVEEVASQVLFQVFTSIPNETSCIAAKPSLELMFEDILVPELRVPEELVSVIASCDADGEEDADRSRVVMDVLVQIPSDVGLNFTAYDLSAVEDMIGTGVNQSNPGDFRSPEVQVVTLNLLTRAERLTAGILEILLQQDLSGKPHWLRDVLIEEVSQVEVDLKTTTTSTSTSMTAAKTVTTTTSTSTSMSETTTSTSLRDSSSSISTTSTTLGEEESSDPSLAVLSFTLVVAIPGNGSDVEVAEAFRRDAAVIEELRREYAANVSIPQSAVEMILTASAVATSKVQISLKFRVTLSSETAAKVESRTRVLSASGFQDLVNVAIMASASAQTYAGIVVESLESIELTTSPTTTSNETMIDNSTISPPDWQDIGGARRPRGFKVGLLALLMMVAFLGSA